REKLVKWMCMLTAAMALLVMAQSLRANPGGAAATRPAPVERNQPREAAGGPHEGEAAEKIDPMGANRDLWTAVVKIGIFILVLAVLYAAAWKPISNGLQNLERAIRESIEAAAKAKSDAEKTTRDLEAKMGEVQRQSAAQLQQAKADALKIAETIRTQA